MTYRPYNVIIAQAASAGSSNVEYQLENTEGSPISDLTPVCTSATGGFKLVDVSSETDALNIVGITKEPILNATVGAVVGFGRMLDVSLPFPLNSSLWVAKDGTITDLVPNTDENGFVAGDFVIRVGKIVKNQTDPLKKDIIINMQLIGQLG